jgi:hypothetical protein
MKEQGHNDVSLLSRKKRLEEAKKLPIEDVTEEDSQRD